MESSIFLEANSLKLKTCGYRLDNMYVIQVLSMPLLDNLDLVYLTSTFQERKQQTSEKHILSYVNNIVFYGYIVCAFLCLYLLFVCLLVH